jgi:hypothetical protein
MATGILIAESLQDDARLQVVSWQLTRIERVTVTNLSEEQRAAGLPSARTLLHFKLADARARAVAHALADGLMRFGWYAEFNTEAETFAVFAGRVSVALPHEGSVVEDRSSTGPHSVEGAGADSSMGCDRVDDPLVGR